MKVSRILLGSFLVLVLAACGGNGESDPIDPTTPPDPTTTDPTTPDPTITPDPTTTPDPTLPDPTTTTDPSDPTVTMSGTWAGTTTTPGVYDTEPTTLTLSQSGTSLSGTLEVTGADGTFDSAATGSLNGTTATISATFQLEAGGTVTYSYQGTVTSTTYSGNITLRNDSGQTASGTFALTKGGEVTDPSDPTDPTTTTDPSDPTTTTDPSNPSGTISGTVIAPTGVDVSDTAIGACLSSSPSGTCTGLVETTVNSAGAYTLTGLEPASYTVIGVIDSNGNGMADAGDYVGGLTDVTPPASGVNFSLTPYQGPQSPELNQLLKSISGKKQLDYRRAP